MTDAERQVVNKRIAEAMGAERGGSNRRYWLLPDLLGGGGWQFAPPDFFTEPKAADALMRWLFTQPGWTVLVGTSIDGQFASVSYDEHKDSQHGHSDDDWKVALALAADAAIKEATNDQ